MEGVARIVQGKKGLCKVGFSNGYICVLWGDTSVGVPKACGSTHMNEGQCGAVHPVIQHG